VDDAMPKDWQHYEKYAYLFDARAPEARDRARARWREWSDQGKQLAYWNFDGNEWSLMRQSC
jgi:DNA polymerase IIIc chi subunit